ncbi:MAG: MFS transporter [archaeon]
MEEEKKKGKLFNKDFFLLWQGQLVSHIGTQACNIAMMFWIKHITGSATLMGLVMMAVMLPSVILGPVGGTIADRISRKKIIVLGDIINGLFVIGLAFLMFNFPERTNLLLVAIFIVAIIWGIVGAFFRPSITASIPDVVTEEKVQAANSMNQLSIQLSTFIGQGIGGLFFRILGAPMMFLVDGITYLFSSFSESFIEIPQKLPDQSKGVRQIFSSIKSDLIEGFYYVWNNRGMRNVFLLIAIFNFFTMPIIILLPFYVENYLGVSVDWYGYIIASYGIGSIFGYAAAGGFKLSGNKQRNLIIFGFVISGLIFAVTVFTKIPLVSSLLFFLFGILTGFITVNILSILQLSTPADKRGRVFGFYQTFAASISPIAMGFSGVIFDMINHNIKFIFLFCGLIVSFITIIVSLDKDFRDFLSFESEKNMKDIDMEKGFTEKI